MLAAGAAAAAVCGVHAPLNPSQELAFAAALKATLQQQAPGKT
jgi:N-methylhydantoinase A/oxoprolinase/acetone carboxylase beta subunit